MSQKKNLPLKMGLIYGAALGTVVISFGIIRYQTGMILRDDHTLSYLYWAIFTLSIFYAVRQFKRRNPLFFSYKRSINIGLFAGLVSGLMYTIYIVILNDYFDIELSSKIIQFKKQIYALNNSESAKDAADSIKIMQLSSTLRGLIYTLVCMTFGTIHSLVGTFIVKKLD